MDQPVEFRLSASWPLAALVLGLHLSAAGALLAAFPTLPAGLLALLLVALGGLAAWNRALLKGVRSPRRLLLGPGGTARVILADGSDLPVVASGGTGVTRWWVSLGIQTPQAGPWDGFRRASLLVAGGMLPSASFRLLRLWALWGKLPPVAPSQPNG